MTNTVDFIGVGIGPFNLSIAALSHQAEGLSSRFFDGRPHFAWHPGMLVAGLPYADHVSERSG